MATRAEELLNLYTEIEEKAAQRTISYRGGSRHIRYKCPPGMKREGKRCTRIQAAKRIETSRKLKRAWRTKRRPHLVQQRRNTRLTMRRRRAGGFK